MENQYKDLINGFELTPTNFAHCLDDFLCSFSLADFCALQRDTMLDMLHYVEYAISINDIDLIKFAHYRLIGFLLGF